MKNDQLINSLINFLIPIIFLYGLFFLSDLFISSGFFALVYSVVLSVLGLMIYSANNNIVSNFNHLEIIIFAISLIAMIYVVAILLLITNLFSI